MSKRVRIVLAKEVSDHLRGEVELSRRALNAATAARFGKGGKFADLDAETAAAIACYVADAQGIEIDFQFSQCGDSLSLSVAEMEEVE